MVPRTPSDLPVSGANHPTTTPATTATMTPIYSQWVRSRRVEPLLLMLIVRPSRLVTGVTSTLENGGTRKAAGEDCVH